MNVYPFPPHAPGAPELADAGITLRVTIDQCITRCGQLPATGLPDTVVVLVGVGVAACLVGGILAITRARGTAAK